MKHKNTLKFYQTGWFYLHVAIMCGLIWLINTGSLASFTQKNLEWLYQLKPINNQNSQIVRVKLSNKPEMLAKVNELLALLPNTHFVIVVNDEQFNHLLPVAKNSLLDSNTQKVMLVSAANFLQNNLLMANQSLQWSDYGWRNVRQASVNQLSIATSWWIYPHLFSQQGFATIANKQQQILPTALAGIMAMLDDTEQLNLNKLVDMSLSNASAETKSSWLLGVNGELYFGGAGLTTSTWNRLKKQAKPKLVVLDFVGGKLGERFSQAVAKIETKSYLVTNIISLLAFCLVLIFGLWFCVKLSTKNLIIQGVGFVGFIVVILMLQYLFFTQLIWFSILPIIVLVLPSLIVINCFRFEQQQFIAQQKITNQVLATSANHFYQQREFDKLQPYLEQTQIDLPLAETLFDIALQAEAENNSTFALKTLELVESSKLNHQPSLQKLNDYRQQNETQTEALDSTMVIAPGQKRPQTLINPALQIKQFGRYEVEGVLGKGAMGIVFQGVDPKINRHVAIKTLQLSIDSDDDSFTETKMRFFREAETAGNLSHANIVTIYDVGEEGELGYIAMDLLTGAPLSKFLKANQLLPTPLVYQLMIQITDALDYAHKQHVVHRDIKPANIIYDDEIQRVTLTDFGIACVTDQSKTRTGTIMGSPFYMSPEQVLGKKVDGRSDIFSLGVTFYQLLSGSLPFNGESIASVAFHITNTKHESVRHWNSKLPASTVRITNKALQKDPNKRFQTMDEFKQALINALKRDFKKAPII